MNIPDPMVFSEKTKLGSGLAGTLAWATAAAVVGAGIRYGIVDLKFFRDACQADILPWWCWPRQLVIAESDLWIIGVISVICAAYGLVKPGPTRAALMAVIFGALGIALYNAGPASIGLVFGLATIARHRA
jgi:hypothetical protein